jgi:hypothetical protein
MLAEKVGGCVFEEKKVFPDTYTESEPVHNREKKAITRSSHPDKMARNHVLCYLVNRSAEDAYSSAAPDPTLAFVGGPCCPTLDFVIAFWIMIAFYTLLTSLFCIERRSVHKYSTFPPLIDPP